MMRISVPIEQEAKRRRRDRHGGFTLMEVVLALTIAGMLATLAVPYFRATQGPGTVLARANEIASLMRRDRNMALRLERRSTVLIDQQRGTIRSVLLAQGIVLPDGIKLRMIPDNAAGVAFAADGTSSGGRIILSARRASFAIDVNRLTAAVSVSGIGR